MLSTATWYLGKGRTLLTAVSLVLWISLPVLTSKTETDCRVALRATSEVSSSYHASLGRAASAGPVVHAVSAAPEFFVCPLKSLAAQALTAGCDAL